MRFFKRNILFYFLAAVVFFFFNLCSKDDISDEFIVNSEIYKVMRDIYLWYEYVPDADISSFETPYELMDYLKYKPLDKWSYVMPKDEYLQYFEEGEMIGHGLLLGTDSSGRVRISFIYASTQAFEQGIRRGWIVDKINDVVITRDNLGELIGPREIGIRNKFEFINPDGKYVTLYLIKEALDITPVLYHEIITSNNKLIGYIVFQDFIDAAILEIDNVFTEFKNNNIDELIMDLRYNSGGSVSVAEYLAGWIAGNKYSDRAFVKFIHNNKYPDLDTVINVPYNENGLDLERIFFIGTNSTASASELLINGLEPYMDVILVGNNTHGKPVGMYALPFTNYNYVILPVCFKFTNGNDEGDFYDGLVPDSYSEDDITRDFGDPQEDCLEETLNIMETGTPSVSRKKSTRGGYLLETDRQINKFLRAY
jgi:carboxyl-terminal processing protease